ncbi:MAG TPA: hypothetical protein VFC53_01530 [Dehalococcoidia bacterium]|nr:hypothetical protein [Dehalococcoidia bacterium]
MAAPPAERWVDIFVSGHEGYGDSRRGVRQYAYNRVHGALHLRTPGELATAPPVVQAPAAFNTPTPCPFAVEWEDTTPNPILLFGIADLVYTSLGNSFSTVSAGATITDGKLHDDGSGVPYLYLALGGGGSTKVKRRNRAGTITACTNLVAEKLLSLNNDLYITATPAGGTAICAVGKVAAGTDPGSAAQPALTVVGRPTTKINNLVADAEGRAPVALKPEGIFGYDRALNVWRAIGKVQYHPDNGKAFWYEQGFLCVALGAGGAVRVRGTQLERWDPLPESATADESTTGQVITAAATLQNGAILVTAPGAKRAAGGGTQLDSNAVVDFGKTTDGGAGYTDYSTAVSDMDPTTYADLSLLDTPANGDWFVVGHVRPFIGVVLDILAANTNAATVTAEIWTAFGWQSVGVAELTGGATPLQRTDGRAMYIVTSDPLAIGWQQTALTVGSPKTRYWMRFSYSAALSATVRIRGVRVMPWMPRLAPAGSLATLPNVCVTDGLDRAGAFPHVLYSHVDESGRHVVHDLGSSAGAGSQGGIDIIEQAVHAIGGKSLGLSTDYRNGFDRSVVLIGLKRLYLLDFFEHLTEEQWPFNSPGIGGLVEFAAVDLGGPAQLRALEVEGRGWEAAGHLFHRFEDGRAWSAGGHFDAIPWRADVANAGAGSQLRVALAIKPTYGYGTQRSRVTRVRALVRDVKRADVALAPQNPPVVA